MFEQLAAIERAVREHAPDVIDELRRAVDALDEIATSVGAIAHYLASTQISAWKAEREVIDGTSERVK